ncbi:F-box domain-containing protein [Mycena sanguinolenta]|uniref:F-box domain-containing protein n=1 Tax=Mycena sanguinolenta TaxID=230812 RepID=A0A8H6YFD8_9AGAR|nr:F-box domain-containing protein [Mycena sanguinolenta]
MAPRLRKSSITIHLNEPHVLLPWAQLTNLTLDYPSLDAILDILAQCASLVYASLITSRWHVYVAAVQLTRPPIILSHLHALSLDLEHPKHMTRFKSVVSAPALEILHLNFMSMHHTTRAPFLMQSPNITRLEICGSHSLTSHELVGTLRHTVLLTHLELAYLTRHSLDDALIDALSCKDGVAPLVPYLHHLVLKKIDTHGFATKAFEHMLLSRWWTDAEITSSPPVVSRWTQVELRGKYSEQFIESTYADVAAQGSTSRSY